MAFSPLAFTLQHIRRASGLILHCSAALIRRAAEHDASKLVEPEWPGVEKYTEPLAKLTFGTPEYDAIMREARPIQILHHAANRHHPEHFENGISGMTLIDLTEMVCDWRAAVEKHQNGDIYKSIEICQQRYGFSNDLKAVFQNTVKWLEQEDSKDE